jgi:dihydroxyacetone kinase-like protein
MAKKFINAPENLLNELLEGFVLSCRDKIQIIGDRLVARKVPKTAGKVALVTLGGSGHEPGLIGFVGEGMLDISVPGEIFAAPGPERCFEAIKMADRGAGVLFIVLNHAGDILTANYTMELARSVNLNVQQVIIHEDIASGPADRPEERRGMVGFIPLVKIAGAAAEAGLDLNKVREIATRTEQNMRTLAIAVSSASHPATDELISNIGTDEMVIGMGQHGEAGGQRLPMKSADEIVDIMLPRLLEDLGAEADQDLLVLLNGSGATTMMELFIVYRRIHQIITSRKMNVIRSRIGEFITTQEQAGFQMFIARMDSELLSLWDAPCDAPYFSVR